MRRVLTRGGRAVSGAAFAAGLALSFAALLLWPLPSAREGGARAAQGEGWRTVRQGVAGRDLNAVHFVDSRRGWAGGDGGLVLRTEDGGRTWEPQSLGTSDGVNDIYFRDREDGYVLAGNRVFTTEDGGRAWRRSGEFLPGAFDGALPELYSVRFTSKRKGWVVGSVSRRDVVTDGLLLSTDDRGASWARQPSPSRSELIHLDFDGDKKGWIVGASGTILHTRDGGRTWSRQNSGTKVTLYHVEFNGDERGWAVGERGTILRTTNGGQTWLSIAPPVRTTLLSVEFPEDDEGWIVGRGGVILRSDDGGRTWIRQESRTRQNLYALFMEDERGWAVGGDGTILQYER